MKKYLFILALAFGLSLSTQAQVNLWSPASETEVSSRSGERYTTPTVYGLFKVDVEDLRAELEATPHETEVSSRNSYSEFAFPMPDGSFRTFRIVEFDMIEPGLARKYPHIKTYTGVDLEHGGKIHINLTKEQVFVTIREKGTTYYIDPFYRRGADFYASYDIKNYDRGGELFYCDQHTLEDGEIVEKTEFDLELNIDKTAKRTEALTLKSFRIAVAATFGFTDFYGGTTAGALDGIVTIITRINSVYERDHAIRLILIANNDQVIFTTQDDDPFDDIPNGDQAAFLNINQTLMTSTIGVSNYDIGHVFNIKSNSATGQGIAQLNSTCSANGKARGSSARPNPQGDPFTVSIVGHELGHQFGATHTMYHCQNVTLNTGFEPGSGTTIMSYAGICGNPANIQTFTDDYFHGASIQQVKNFKENVSCGTEIDLSNTHPEASLNYPAKTYIPVNTPFKLEGSATDAETPGSITYCWEQVDGGSRTGYDDNPWNIANPRADEPLFRSRPPTADNYRYFPALPTVVAQGNYLFEQLPTLARDMEFRMTVRDNASENGGTDYAEMAIEVIDNSAAGQFQLTSYNVKDTILNGAYVELEWDVADTDKSPINTDCVDIYMSVDGGTSFPHLIKSRTANDGSTFVNIPDLSADRFRFMIAASDNIYFDVTNRSGLLMIDSTNARIGLSYDDSKYSICGPEVIQLEISTIGLGGYDGMVSFDYTGVLPTGAVASFSDAEVAAGESTTLTLDLTSVSSGGTFDIEFTASGDNVADQVRKLDMTVTTANFQNLTLNSPANGSTGVGFFTDLEWSLVPDGLTYTVELSDMADFSNIVYSESGLTSGVADPGVQLDAGKVYFWRVIPSNPCGDFDINKVSSFQVKSLSCDEYTYSGGNLLIPGSQAFVGEMEINIGAAKTVDDLSITEITGFHNRINDLIFRLKGPNNTEALLLDRSCPWTGDIDMGFDDDAVGVLPDCGDFATFSKGTKFEPEDAMGFDAIEGETGSVFTLVVEDAVAGQGGRIESWKFEICADANPEAPLLVSAGDIEMEIMETRTVQTDKLEVTHGQYGAGEITLTVVDDPIYGQMLLDGTPITSGAQFTMQDVIDDKLTYQHQENFEAIDKFTFIATDPGGGYVGTPAVNFYVGISSTSNPLPAGSQLNVFPNPITNVFNVELKGNDLLLDHVRIYSIQGQLIANYSNVNNHTLEIDASTMTKGMYVLEVRSGEYTSVRKLIK